MSNRKWHLVCLIGAVLSILLIIVLVMSEFYPPFKLNDKTKVGLWTLVLVLFFIFVIFSLFKRNQTEDLPEDLPENPTQSRLSKPKRAPISYLRTLSLPTYEMAMNKLNRKKNEETPPPQFHELQFHGTGLDPSSGARCDTKVSPLLQTIP